MKILNSIRKTKKQPPAAKDPKNWIEVKIKNDGDDSPAEILMMEPIGSDPWSGQGLTAKMFKDALSQVPKHKAIDLVVNSKGGDVHEGMAIKSMLDEWPNRTTCNIVGIAASTASWIPMGCDEIRCSRNSQMFVHDAIALGYGNAEDLRKTADELDKTSDQIAGMYADKSGKGQRTMRQLMQQETLLTGEEAE